jgi:hypothetical protein
LPREALGALEPSFVTLEGRLVRDPEGVRERGLAVFADDRGEPSGELFAESAAEMSPDMFCASTG